MPGIYFACCALMASENSPKLAATAVRSSFRHLSRCRPLRRSCGGTDPRGTQRLVQDRHQPTREPCSTGLAPLRQRRGGSVRRSRKSRTRDSAAKRARHCIARWAYRCSTPRSVRCRSQHIDVKTASLNHGRPTRSGASTMPRGEDASTFPSRPLRLLPKTERPRPARPEKFALREHLGLASESVYRDVPFLPRCTRGLPWPDVSLLTIHVTRICGAILGGAARLGAVSAPEQVIVPGYAP